MSDRLVKGVSHGIFYHQGVESEYIDIGGETYLRAGDSGLYEVRSDFGPDYGPGASIPANLHRDSLQEDQ